MFPTLAPSGPAPITSAERRASGRSAWRRITAPPNSTAANCTTGVSTAHHTSTELSKNLKLLVAKPHSTRMAMTVAQAAHRSTRAFRRFS